jgi:hypothetical protein
MYKFEEICRPVIFSSEHEQFPYWGKGSSFLIANSHSYYWITAHHVIKNLNGEAKNVRIYPSDNSKISLPFDAKYTIENSLGDDEYKDIYILRINLNEFDSVSDAPLVAQDIASGIMSTGELSQNDELWVMGFPSIKSEIDYDKMTIQNTRVLLKASYQGENGNDQCHSIAIDSSIQLTDYDGLSGGPVFYMLKQIHDGEILEFPLLVGMILRGTAESKIAHFVGSDVFIGMINSIENNA